MTASILFIILFACMFMGMPIAIALGFSSVVTIYFLSGDSIASMGLKFIDNLTEHYTLLAIPSFLHGRGVPQQHLVVSCVLKPFFCGVSLLHLRRIGLDDCSPRDRRHRTGRLGPGP